MSIIAKENIPVEKQPRVPFYINRNYAFLWSGQSISVLGDLIFDTTLTLWIATGIAGGQSWAPLATGGAALCISLPGFLVGPLAGVFVDRWEKRSTMIRMDVLRAALVALLLLVLLPFPFLHGGSLPALWQLGAVYLVLILTTVCAQFFGPARLTIIQEVVNESQFEKASGLSMLTQNTARIIGPSLAAPTLFVFGVQWALLVNAASFLVSALAVRSVRVTPALPAQAAADQSTRGGFWAEFREGLLFFGKSRVLVVLLCALSLIIIGDAAEQTLGVFFMLSNLHVPVYLYGVIGTVGGIGGILGALTATLIVKRLGTARSFSLGVLGFGVLLLIFSRLTTFAPALVLIFLVGFPISMANVALAPLFLRATPRELLGRVNAVFSTSINVVNIVAAAAIGALASALYAFHVQVWGFWLGPYDTIFSMSGLLNILIGLGIALTLPRLVAAQIQAQAEEKTPQGDSSC